MSIIWNKAQEQRSTTHIWVCYIGLIQLQAHPSFPGTRIRWTAVQNSDRAAIQSASFWLEKSHALPAACMRSLVLGTWSFPIVWRRVQHFWGELEMRKFWKKLKKKHTNFNLNTYYVFMYVLTETWAMDFEL